MQSNFSDLWKQQDLPAVRISMEDVRKRAKRLKTAVRIRTAKGLAVAAFLFACFIYFAIQVHDWPRRLGALLTAVAVVYFVYQLLESRGKKAPPLEVGTSASVTFLRHELERQRDFHRGWRFWTRVVVLYPGYLLFCWGSAVAEPGAARVYGWIVVTVFGLGGIGVWLNLAKAQKYQRLIDEMDNGGF
jgi:hypothetical protein